ncbi:MAG: NAD(P)-binding domain-containing protein, partial [Phycisphaerales bacterium]
MTALLHNTRDRLEAVLASGSGDHRRPALRRGNESNVRGLYIIGDLAGAPVIKLAMAQGVEVVDFISRLPDMQTPAEGDTLDVLIVGAGAAGLNAALAAQDKGYRHVVLEKGKIANTIENFPEGKWVYAEPDDTPAKGKLWLDGATKEDLVARWTRIISDHGLDVRTEEPLTQLYRRGDGTFDVTTPKNQYHAKKIILATGQRGNPRTLGAPGEDLEQVYHRLYSPTKYHDEDVFVVGGGNSAVEAALTLAKRNRVVLSYRGAEFSRLFKDNRRQIDQAIAAGRIEVIFNSHVAEFRPGAAVVTVDYGGHQEEREVPMDHGFVLIGADLPVKFLKSIGVRLENEWTASPFPALVLTTVLMTAVWFAGVLCGAAGPFGLGTGAGWVGAGIALASLGGLIGMGVRGDRWSWLGVSFFVWYSIYGIKVGSGSEFWPYRGWGYDTMSFFGRPWAFWYTILYTTLMTVFGVRALKRWGLDRRDRFQIWRFASLISFQWVFFFIIPEFL